VPASVRRFMARARRRRGSPTRRWGLAAGAIGTVGLLAWVVWVSPLLAVAEVRVTGTDVLSPADVREVAAVTEGTPLSRVRVAEVADRVGSLAPVAQVEVSRSWPTTLEVAVTERTAVAAVPVGGQFGLLDGDGVVFHTVASPPGRLPIVELSEPGPDDPSTAAALTVLAALTPELRAQLGTLTAAGPARIELRLDTGRTVVWGDDSASDEKARVATALLDRDAEVIDVSAPEVVVLR
jgi:cell division protein FtsQ